MPPPPLSIRGIRDALRVPTLRDLVFSAKAYLAAVLALLIGFSQNLENPYWAVLTVYIVLTPPETGAVRSKALFRLIGTVGGGLLIMGVTGLFGDQLGILVTATIAIVSVAVFLRQLDRTPANYLWFSGGITAGVVGLTNLMAPTNVFAYGTARMGEILLGILSITAVDSVLWPRPMTPDFVRTIGQWREQARGWVARALDPSARAALDEAGRQSLRAELRDLAKAVGAIDMKAVQLPFDVVPEAPRGQALDLVRSEIVRLIADLVAVDIWARALPEERTADAALAPRLKEVTAWMADGDDLSEEMIEAYATRGDALLRALLAAADETPDADEASLLRHGLLTRTASLVRHWADLSAALLSITEGRALPAALRTAARQARPVRSVDYLGAALDVAPIVLSMTFTTLLWYFTAWSSGAGALLFSFIGCVFLVGQGGILLSGAGLLVSILSAFGLVFLYQYAILPRVTDFPVLIAVIGCAMLPLGLFMAMSMAGMLIAVFTFAFLGLQNAYSADFNQSLQTLSASLVGLLIALTSLYLCSYDHGRFASRRLVRAVRRDIVDLARDRRVPGRQRFLFLTVDRLALYFTAAGQAAQGDTIPRLRMIEDFGVGINLLTLREHEGSVAPVTRDIIRRLRIAIAEAFNRKLNLQPDDAPLREAVQKAIADPALEAEPARGKLLEALAGMRLAIGNAATPLPGDAEAA